MYVVVVDDGENATTRMRYTMGITLPVTLNADTRRDMPYKLLHTRLAFLKGFFCVQGLHGKCDCQLLVSGATFATLTATANGIALQFDWRGDQKIWQKKYIAAHESGLRCHHRRSIDMCEDDDGATALLVVVGMMIN